MTIKFVPTLSETTDIIGVVLLFIPYLVIMLPYFQSKIVLKLRNLYLHKTPRTDWNPAVNEYPPRRLIGYILSEIYLLSVSILLYINHTNNNNLYPVNIIQYFIYTSIPIFLSIVRPHSKMPCDFIDIIIFCFITIPLELSKSQLNKNDKFLPDVEFDINDQESKWPNISMLRLTAFNMALFIFFIFRPLKNIGIGYNINHYINFKCIVLRFIVSFIIFSIVAVPVGILYE